MRRSWLPERRDRGLFSHALSQGRSNEIEFAVGVFTNLTRDHLDFHRGMKDYFEAKARLFESLRQSRAEDRKAVINIDDPYGQQLVGRFGKDLSDHHLWNGRQSGFSGQRFQGGDERDLLPVGCERQELPGPSSIDRPV